MFLSLQAFKAGDVIIQVLVFSAFIHQPEKPSTSGFSVQLMNLHPPNHQTSYLSMNGGYCMSLLLLNVFHCFPGVPVFYRFLSQKTTSRSGRHHVGREHGGPDGSMRWSCGVSRLSETQPVLKV